MNIDKFIYNELLKVTSEENIKVNEPMSKHTSFKVGGPADFLVDPSNRSELVALIRHLKTNNIPYTIIGNGSNLLVKDGGIRGVVVRVGKKMNSFSITDDVIYAQAGALMPVIGNAALKNSLTGFEFAAGIPGTLGGAIRMNAGAHGGEMKDIVTSVQVLTKDGLITNLKNEQMEFEYRNSILSKEEYIVLEVTFQLRKGNPNEIKAAMDKYKEYRLNTQPLNMPSAGSTFKRVENVSVGKILQDMGLKGLSLNGAQVSEKHGGFIVNAGKETTAKDIINLIEVVKSIVLTKHNIKLEEEVRIIGED